MMRLKIVSRSGLGLLNFLVLIILSMPVSGYSAGDADVAHEALNHIVVDEELTLVPTPQSVIGKTTSKWAEFPPVVALGVETPPFAAPPIETFSIDWDVIVNLGKQVWQVVTNNKAVANITVDYANALPDGVKSPWELAGFSDLVYTSYNAKGKNGFGGVVYDITFTLVHQYGGSLMGKGQYLSNVGVIPSQIKVMWGNTLNFNVRQLSIVNVGTQEAPIASLALQFSYDIKSMTQSYTRTVIYQFRGDREVVSSSEIGL